MKAMLLKQLKYFISIVEKGNFTEAAEENYISQSAISQQIQSLENANAISKIMNEAGFDTEQEYHHHKHQ
jgi:DNA-binding MarR family transcriptional regulator